jgi:hypothetical protein
LQPTYAALACGAQASPVVATDETGRRVGGRCPRHERLVEGCAVSHGPIVDA